MRLPTLPSQADVSLTAMRRAFRTTEAVSALLSAAILWPLLFVEVAVVVVAVNFIRAGNLRGLLKAILLMTVIFLIVSGLYLLINWFFSSAGCLVSIVSFALWGSCLYLWMRSYFQLASITPVGKGDLNLTFALAFSHALLAFFFSHGYRVGLLDRDERRVLSRNPTKEFATLLKGRGLKGIRPHIGLLSRIVAGLLQVVAKMIQGLASYMFCFVFGATLVSVTLLLLLVWELVFRSNHDASPKQMPMWILRTVIFYVVVLAIAFLLTHLTFLLKGWARSFSRFSFEQTVKLDTRPQTLFLRSFTDDHVTLPRSPLYLKYWLAEPSPRRLDHILVERFGYLAPVVAIGRPEDKGRLPYGAARIFVENQEWQLKVCELAERAQHVVIVVDEPTHLSSEPSSLGSQKELQGLEWEIQTMLNEPFVDRSLFIASPRLAAHGLETHPLLSPLLTPLVKLSKNFHVLAAFRDGSTWRFLTTKKSTADDYIVCCQAFFRRGLAKTSPKLYKKSHDQLG